MSKSKIFAGALAVAGLMTACGGEVEGMQDDVGVTTNAVIENLATRGAFEPISCNMDYYKRTYYVGDIKVVEQCRIASVFTHQYRAGVSPMTFSADQSLYINSDGRVSDGIIDGNQAVYTGTSNGLVTFQGGQRIALTGSYGSAMLLGSALLAADTCLITGKDSSNAPIWAACAGGTSVSFNNTPGHATCSTLTTAITCP